MNRVESSPIVPSIRLKTIHPPPQPPNLPLDSLLYAFLFRTSMRLALLVRMLLFSLSSRFLPRASAAFCTSLLQQNVIPQQRCLSGISRHKKKERKFEQRSAPPKMKGSGPKKITNRPSLLRADRVLSNRGWGSRSECFDALKQKRVKVFRDDKYQILTGPSDRIGMNDALWVDHKEVPTIPLLLVYHKPKWVLSVLKDPQGRPCLDTVLPLHYQNQDLHPVGRLDYDTSGLLLFSSNGPLTQKLLHPSHEISKQYMAIVEGRVEEEELKEKLTNGVETADGTHMADLVDVQHLTEDASEQVWKHVRATLPSEYNATDLEERRYLPPDDSTILSQVRLVVREGKHRMVRKMLANCGHGVVELKREEQGVILLGDLPQNSFRNLTIEELAWAQTLLPTTGKKKKPLKPEIE
jgi:23S rRNA pseudouridine2605 synthase